MIVASSITYEPSHSLIILVHLEIGLYRNNN